MNAIEIYENAIRMLEINGEITLGEFEDMIKPLEDVAPVVHGEWISDDDGNISCSSCGRGGVGEAFCEHCGARMDGEK